MKLNRFSTVAVAGAALLALASCSAAGGDSDSEPTASQGSSVAAGEVNTEAPVYDQLPEAIKSAGVINIAGDTHPPYRTLQQNGDITGIDPDIQAALSEQLGVPFAVQTASGLDAMLTGMLSGRYDAFNGPTRTTLEREADFDAVVWMTTRTSYLYLAERKDDLDAPEDLCGARVAGVTGSVTESQLERYAEWCAEKGLDAPEFVGLKDTNSTILAVQSDRADYAGTTQTAALDVQSKDEGTFEFLVQTDEQGAGVDQLALFMPKDNELAPAMLAAFEGIFENGEYDRIMSEWKLDDVTVESPTLNPMTAGESGK
ncbi:transporter substrate-binding domain-containing protein [Arthrobacter sp. zg-Y916]|uniref:transporter substrate-binding domain-containing protein n=1 Tax=Arthrobacter sp. zg-Y916 TaxID=2894190 RepID=UPI001E3B4C23|nr:transporter substrate-binding domain-containing protein [Arthrobacter sp. zg-Y916]MCC9195214.1 transporter substrate-binding domain-containing protein [Arthrobacter sp. zg-Y916]